MSQEKKREIFQLTSLIISKLENDCSLYLREIQKKIWDDHRHYLSMSTIHNYIKKRANFSHKKINFHHPRRYLNGNFQVRLNYLEIISRALRTLDKENIFLWMRQGSNKIKGAMGGL
ncbi:hypothetical protein M0813_14531 [Anaeramoeba flamelloides]|nr:hypothetical protein M0813_14531 [Anaeramoeba flamelloides]